MNFLTRIISQMIRGPLGEKLANAKWMQSLAQNTNKGIENWGKTAAEQKEMWTETSNAMKQNASQMKTDAQNSSISKYFKGLGEEMQQMKEQIKEDTKHFKE